MVAHQALEAPPCATQLLPDRPSTPRRWSYCVTGRYVRYEPSLAERRVVATKADVPVCEVKTTKTPTNVRLYHQPHGLFAMA